MSARLAIDRGDHRQGLAGAPTRAGASLLASDEAVTCDLWDDALGDVSLGETIIRASPNRATHGQRTELGITHPTTFIS
jgi:hypothetical protein